MKTGLIAYVALQVSRRRRRHWLTKNIMPLRAFIVFNRVVDVSRGILYGEQKNIYILIITTKRKKHKSVCDATARTICFNSKTVVSGKIDTLYNKPVRDAVV